MLFRFFAAPILLPPPDASEFRCKILEIHRELKLKKPENLEELSIQAVESTLGFRWLEGYLGELIIRTGLSLRFLFPQPQEEPFPSAAERLELLYGKRIGEL